MNVTMLAGRISRPPEERSLPSGDRVVAYDVTVPNPGDRADTVPVVWHDPPAAARKIGEGDEVVVVGRVRRRFFRSGASTQSRTEVVADAVVNARQVKRCQTLLEKAAERAVQRPPADDRVGPADHRPGDLVPAGGS